MRTGKVISFGKKLILVLMLVLLVLPGLSYAITWEGLLKKAKKKYAGYEKQIKDMVIKQVMKTYTEEDVIKSEMTIMRKGDKFRIETIMDTGQKGQDMKNIIMNDGKQTWLIAPYMGKRKLGKNEDTQDTKNEWWKMGLKSGKVTGEEKVGKRKCYVVKFKKSKPFSKVWIDKKSLVMVKYNAIIKKKTTTGVFSNFKKIKKKWLFSYKSKIYMGKKLLSESIVKNLKINQGLSDGLFDPNKVKVKGLKIPGIGGMMKDFMQKQIEGGVKEKVKEEVEEAVKEKVKEEAEEALEEKIKEKMK